MTESDQDNSERLGLRKRIAYGFGALADPLVMGNTIQLLFPMYNAVLGLSGKVVGFLIFLPRIWDAISDPLIGQLSDNCKSKWGRRRPYLFVGAIGVALAYISFWVSPFAKGNDLGNSIWLLFSGIAVYTFYTVYHIPYHALGFELSQDYDERTRIMGTRTQMAQIAEMFRLYALPLGLLLIAPTVYKDNERVGYGVAGFVYGLILLVCCMIPVIFVRERFGQSAAAGYSFWKSVWTTLKDKLYLRLVIFQVIFLLGLFFLATTIIYLQQMYMGEPSLPGHTNVLTAFLVIAWAWAWGKITPHIGKVRALQIGAVCLVIAAVGTWFAFVPGHRIRAFLFPFLWAPGWSAYMVMIPAIIADLTDVDELLTGRRREGSYASVMGFVTKLGMAGVAPIIGIVLDDVVHFNADLGAAQTDPGVWFRMRVCTMIFPTVFSALAFLLLIKFPLTKERMREVHALLDQRKQQTLNDENN